VTKNARSLGGNSRKIRVADDSAGGNLATVVARRARKSGFPLLFEGLFYPSTDIDRTDFASYADYGQGYLLTTKAVETFRKFYLPRNRDWCNPDASPLKSSKSDLALLPPTIIYVAGCDPLRDEGLT
jgi:acetyl esterase